MYLAECIPTGVKIRSLPPFTGEERESVNVVIETPRDCRVKYSWSEEHECLQAKKVLPLGSSFPFDFGFIPGTKAEDGDPIDVLVLVDVPLAPGAVLEARLVGVIEAEQTEAVDEQAKKKAKKQKPQRTKTTRNDRLIAVANITIEYRGIEHIRDVSPVLLEQIQAFFEQYNRLSGKKFRVIGVRGPKTATRLVEKAIEAKQAESAEEASSQEDSENSEEQEAA